MASSKGEGSGSRLSGLEGGVELLPEAASANWLGGEGFEQKGIEGGEPPWSEGGEPLMPAKSR